MKELSNFPFSSKSLTFLENLGLSSIWNFLFFKKKIEVELIYNIVLLIISSVQQSGTYIHFQILFHFSLLQDIECSCFYYIVNSYLFILCIECVSANPISSV